MKFSATSTDYKYPTVVRHQGMSIVLALRKEEVCNIYYRVLATDPAQPDDDKCWSGHGKVSFPEQIRPAGMGLVTVDLKTAERTADAPFQAVSDGKHVYLFRQSHDGTLYVDRFVFDPEQKTLNPNWEARFQRSRKRDIPASRKDTVSSRDMENEPFIEPTTELAMVENLQKGRFSVLLLPTSVQSQWRWHIFATHSGGELDSFSIRRSEDGLFDLSDVQETVFKWSGHERRFQSGPAALLYTQQENMTDEYGREQPLKRGARVMLATATTNEGQTAPIAVLDFAVSREGTLALISDLEDQPVHRQGTSEEILELTGNGHRVTVPIPVIQQGAAETDSPMPTVAVDKQDLTVSAGLLDFARTQGAPYLLDGSDGLVHLYFRGEDGDFMVAQFDTLTARAAYTMPVNTTDAEPSQLYFVARQTGTHMNRTTIKVETGTEEDTAKITMKGQSVLAFDGGDDYVQIPHHDRINFGTDEDFTVEAWIKAAPEQSDIGHADNDVIEKWSRVTPYPYVIRYVNRKDEDNKGKIVAARYDGSNNPSITSQTRINDGQFHHVAFVKEGETLYLYIDGVLEGEPTEDTTSGDTKNTSDLYIGQRGNNINRFKGAINDLRIWDKARTGEEIQADMGRHLAGDEPGLVGYWPLDEGSGATVHDKTKWDNQGTLHVGSGDDPERKWLAPLFDAETLDNVPDDLVSFIETFNQKSRLFVVGVDPDTLPDDGTTPAVHPPNGGPLTATQDQTGLDCRWIPEPPGQALHFDGRDDYVELNQLSQDDLVIAGDLTLEAWGKLESPSSVQPRIIHYHQSDDSRLMLGLQRHALSFDGVDDYVSLGNPESLQIEGEITIEAWVKIKATDGLRDIVAHGYASDPYGEVFLRINYGQYQIGSWDGTDYLTSYDIPPQDKGNWVHLAGVYDGRHWILYRNGIEVNRTPGEKGAMRVEEAWAIGAKGGGGERFFSGQIKDIRIWNTARSIDQIGDNMHNQNMQGTGLVGYWPYSFFAATRGTATAARDLALSPKKWTHLAAVYDASNALNLDGRGYVDCGNDVTLNMTEALTVEAWVTRGRTSQKEVVASKWGHAPDRAEGIENEQSWRLYIGTDGKPCFAVRDSNGREFAVQADTNLDQNQPYHLAGVFDASPRKETALELDGFDAYITFGQEIALGATYTVEGWFNSSSETYQSILGLDQKGNGTAISLKNDGGIRYFDHTTYRRRIEIFSEGKNYADGVWHHFAAVRDYPTAALYVDGELIGTAQYIDRSDEPRLPTTEAVICLEGQINDIRRGSEPGGRIRPDRFIALKGHINDIRIWNTARSIEQILANMHNQNVQGTGLVGHWPVGLADKISGQLQDRVGGNHGTLQGGAKIVDVDKCTYRQKIFVDGQLAGSQPLKEKDEAPTIAVTATNLNLGRDASGGGAFQGTIDDVRVWQVGRMIGQIQYYRDHPLPGDAEGLVSCWRFEEGSDKTTFDSKSSNHGRLIHDDPDKIPGMVIPSELNARWSLYVNGRQVETSEVKLDDYGGYGEAGRFTLGAMCDENGALQQHLAGCMDEVRIWNAARTEEQIRDNMHRLLSGHEEGLIGYWPLNQAQDGAVLDRTANRQDGALHGPRLIPSTVPIGNEGPEVRNALGGEDRPQFHVTIAGPPAAVEYGDMQWDAEGNLLGVMKRCYIFQEGGTGAIQLATGFKVGDLMLQYIGQVQTAPTLIGYIEGAPPVPSENLTVNDPVTDDYVGASSIQLTEAKETTQVYTASRDTGFDMSVDFKLGVFLKARAEGGWGLITEIAVTEQKLGMHAYFEHSLGWLSDASVSATVSKTVTKSLALCGSWEEKDNHDGEERYLNPVVGRRYLPNNMGYALVKSATADLYALRMRETGSLVAYQVLPNPDIPEDWNILMFPLKPEYVKNGTLDGWVGEGQDSHPAYRNLSATERGSYFKPLEAYALKEQIEREAKKIEGYYKNFGAVARGQRWKAVHFQKGDPGKGRLLDVLPEQELVYDWETGRDKRSMVNTYVWTADGGFYAEEEQFSSIRQESKGGSYHFLGKAGLFTDLKFAVATIGMFFECDALFGGHLNTTVTQGKEEKAAFGLKVDVEGEGFLNQWEGDQDKQEGSYTSDPAPGKVDAYRFMTFYLAPSNDHFNKFFDEVVDQDWLKAPNPSPSALALREAITRPNEVWRVLHRVTYVSRIPGDEPLDSVPPDVRRPSNISSNIKLLQLLMNDTNWASAYEEYKKETDKHEKDKKRTELNEATVSLVEDLLDNRLDVHSWWAALENEREDLENKDSLSDKDAQRLAFLQKLRRELRQDMTTYLQAAYESGVIEELRAEKGKS